MKVDPLTPDDLRAVDVPAPSLRGVSLDALPLLLDELRMTCAEAGREPGIATWSLLTTPPPAWLHLSLEQTRVHYQAQKPLRSGRVQWAFVLDSRTDFRVVGNTEAPQRWLFDEGTEDIPPLELCETAGRIRALSRATTHTEEESAFVRALGAVRSFGDRVRVPAELARGRSLWIAWGIVDARHAPIPCRLAVVPIVTSDQTPFVRLVPSALWPATLMRAWSSGLLELTQ